MIAAYLLAGLATAAEPPVPQMDAQIFQPAIDSRATYQVDESGHYDRAKPIFRALLGYSRDALVADSTADDHVAVLRDLVNLDLIGGYDFGPARLALRLPLVYAAGDLGRGGGIGDLEVDARGTLLGRDKWPVGLAVAGGLSVPTSNDKMLPLGSSSVGWSARVILDGEAGPALLALNLGVTGQPVARLENAVWGTQLITRGGATFAVKPKVDVSAEVSALLDVTKGVHLDSAPVEGGLGAAFHTGAGVGVRVGLMAGMTPGLGDPAVRALVGLDYERKRPSDTDGDGITDDQDGCITVPEDVDGYEDTDGCPELAHVELRFVDEDHQPVADVRAELAGAVGTPGWEVNGGEYLLRATATGFEPLEATLLVPHEGLSGVERMMHRVILPGLVDVRVHNAEGAPIDANWTLGEQSGTLAGGSGILSAVAGHYFLSLAAPGYGSARLGLDLISGKTASLDVVLAPPQVAVKEKFIELNGTVYFATNTAILEDRGLPLLRELAGTLADHPELLKVSVEGHTDNRGSATYNLTLSDSRARAVRDFLIAQGVDESRLLAAGFGESRPIDPANNELAWSVNRRVEVRIVERAKP